MGKAKKTPELIERAVTLKDIGWQTSRIAKEVGVHAETVRRWLIDAADSDPELEDRRQQLRICYIESAWEIVNAANEILKEQIKSGVLAKTRPKEVATVMGIYLDKITGLEARGATKPQTPPIQINILPPNGNTTRVIANSIPVYDEPDEVLCDDSGDWVGEDVLRLPESRDDGDGASGVVGGDSGLDLPEPE